MAWFAGVGLGFGGRVGVGEFFAGDGLDFAADDVGGKAGAQQAAVEGGELFVVEFAAEGAELAVNALADHGGLVVFLRAFVESGFDVLVGDAASAQVAGDAELALAADFGALADELFGVAGVVDEAFALEAVESGFDELVVFGAMRQRLLHFVDGMGAAHQDAGGRGVQLGLGHHQAWLAEHAGRIEAIPPGVKKKGNTEAGWRA